MGLNPLAESSELNRLFPKKIMGVPVNDRLEPLARPNPVTIHDLTPEQRKHVGIREGHASQWYWLDSASPEMVAACPAPPLSKESFAGSKKRRRK